MIENDLIKILSKRILSQRLIILSIDIRKRKYDSMRLENLDSFSVDSKSLIRTRIKCARRSHFEERDNVRILITQVHQEFKFNLKELDLSTSHTQLNLCTVDFLFLFFKSIFSVISIS